MKDRDITIGLVGRGRRRSLLRPEIVLASSVSSEGLLLYAGQELRTADQGGESSCRVRFSDSLCFFSQGILLDVLVSFSRKEYAKFDSELDVREDVTVPDRKKRTKLWHSDIPLHGV
jgi:Pyruvate/2-oxoacid:ferredoxin oxidoreductase gamma subunit